MKTFMIAVCLLGACAITPRESALNQSITTTTYCDPITGLCWEEEVSPTGGGGGGGGGVAVNGVFACAYSTAVYDCGVYQGFAASGSNSYLTGDVIFSAEGDPNFQPNLGYSVTCAIASGPAYSYDLAQCILRQGPHHWTCDISRGEMWSTCCLGSSVCAPTS